MIDFDKHEMWEAIRQRFHRMVELGARAQSSKFAGFSTLWTKAMSNRNCRKAVNLCA